MRRIRVSACVLALLVTPALHADEVPLVHWAAPLFWRPPVSDGLEKPGRDEALSAVTRDGVTALPSAPLPFVAVTPCRLIDTRASATMPPGYGTPSMPGVHAQRSFTITGQCAIPADAQAVSFNFAVWAPVTRGDIRVFPAGGGTPNVASLNWEANIQALANAAVVPLGVGGAITVQVDGPGTIDLIADVNGYYAPPNSFCIGADCRTSWNAQDSSSVTPMPRDCAPGQVAVATGSYQWKCGNICQAAGTADCGGTSCAALLADPDNCGSCGAICSSNHMATRTCGGGQCNGNCVAGWGDCDGDRLVNGCETDLSSNSSHCGQCGHVCPVGSVCTLSACVCIGGLTKCNNVCVNTTTDPTNCGACGNVCVLPHATPTCQSSTCRIGACVSGYADCNLAPADGCETATAIDPSNCGSCGSACSNNHILSPTCLAGTCNGVCSAGWGDCNFNKRSDGCETSLTANDTNCGACGTVCLSTHYCSASICTPKKGTGQSCTAGRECVSGVCAGGFCQ